MTYEFVGTEDNKADGKILSLIFRNSSRDEIRISPADFYMGRYEQDNISSKQQRLGAAELVHKGPYPDEALSFQQK